MYLTYEEYTSMGGTLDETAFEDFEFEARSIIDYWTFNRLHNENCWLDANGIRILDHNKKSIDLDEVAEAVKRCMFKLISMAKAQQDAMAVSAVSEDGTIQAGITHVSNDGVATDYNTLSASDVMKTMPNEMAAVVKRYLSGVKNSLGHKVLYRGVYPGE